MKINSPKLKTLLYGFTPKAYVFYGFIALFVVSPLFSEKLLYTQFNDLANHVRHIYEYKLALTEGQFPPIVAPELNNFLRIPIFQFYSGTAYVIGGVISLLGINEYLALKTSIFLSSFLAAICLFKTLTIFLEEYRSAFVGALSFQLFGFAAINLFNRGGYVEWIALQYSAITFWSLIKLAQSAIVRNPLPLFGRFIISIISLTLFIPCHPIQTVCIGIVIAIIVTTYIFTSNLIFLRIRVFAILLTSLIFSLGFTSWFWLPITRYYEQLRITGHQVFWSADTTLQMVLWPWFYPSHLIKGWAPQIGLHITLSLLFLIVFSWDKINTLGKTATLLLLIILFLIILPSWSNDNIFSVILSPLQYSYRLFMPAALLASLVVGFAQKELSSRLTKKSQQTLIFWASVIFIVMYSYPFLHLSKISTSGLEYQDTLAKIKSPGFIAKNSTYYGFLGTDYSKLGWVENGSLKVNEILHLPREGLPFETEITLADKLFKNDQINILVNNIASKTKTLSQNSENLTQLTMSLNPSKGVGAKPVNLQFQSNHKVVPIQDIRFRPLKDSDWLKIPDAFIVTNNKKDKNFKAIVNVRKAGLYQLPVCYYPSLILRVNGINVNHESSDKFLVVVRLVKGENLVEIETKPDFFTKGVFWVTMSVIIFLLAPLAVLASKRL